MPVRNQAISICLIILFAMTPAWSQAPNINATTGPQPSLSPIDPQQAPAMGSHILAPMDQVTVKVPDSEEINGRAFQVDESGNLTLPLVGEIKAAGMSIEQFEAELTKKLRVFIRVPQVSVTVAQPRSYSILLTGAFSHPGLYPLQPSKRLLEMLSSVGGLLPTASRRIKITRRLDQGKLPLENAVTDTTAGVATAEISLSRLMEAANATENIVLQPFDVLYAGKAEMVYVNLPNAKAGAYPLEDREYLSVLQVLSLAGGLDNSADPEKALILRPILNTSRRAEIPVNLKAILEGKQNDYPLMANDVLMVPRGKSVAKSMTWLLPTLISSLIFVAVR